MQHIKQSRLDYYAIYLDVISSLADFIRDSEKSHVNLAPTEGLGGKKWAHS